MPAMRRPRNRVGRRPPRRTRWVGVFVSLLVLSVSTGCGGQSAPHAPDGNENAVADLNRSSVDDIVSSIADAGLPVPNPRDVTQQMCPDLGCQARVDTDTVSVMEFPSTGSAESYAGSTVDVFQVVNVVVTFAPTVSPVHRAEYERAVKRAIL